MNARAKGVLRDVFGAVCIMLIVTVVLSRTVGMPIPWNIEGWAIALAGIAALLVSASLA